MQHYYFKREHLEGTHGIYYISMLQFVLSVEAAANDILCLSLTSWLVKNSPSNHVDVMYILVRSLSFLSTSSVTSTFRKGVVSERH